MPQVREPVWFKTDEKDDPAEVLDMNAYTTAVIDGLLLAIGSVVFTLVCIVCVAMAIREGIR